MISINEVKVSTMAIDGKKVASMCLNGKIIFQSVKSCFGSGVWAGSKPWIEKESWK